LLGSFAFSADFDDEVFDVLLAGMVGDDVLAIMLV
jgi:hypothetical protein